ncbi:hypothetical protein Moror_3951 [Moniliophthora roreri MCA 2997]|uniref:Uncharacterized protein n=1 Tax=Moniliophthora roreri (strain MCA 2997) TaxID=1381753 RepID=V2XR07_MONRO|nr:hypothetical protein Moror_3951 [Moniliophthora roreri MCA 2997]
MIATTFSTTKTRKPEPAAITFPRSLRLLLAKPLQSSSNSPGTGCFPALATGESSFYQCLACQPILQSLRIDLKLRQVTSLVKIPDHRIEIEILPLQVLKLQNLFTTLKDTHHRH